MRPYVLIGNPENRRISLFQEALAERGAPPATVVSWLSLVDGPEALAAVDLEEAIVKIDSAGENFELEKAFLTRGYRAAVQGGYSVIGPQAVAAMQFDRGKIVCPRQTHLGFLEVVESLRPVFAERAGWDLLTPLDEIPVLFDKRETSRRYQALGLPIPDRLDDVESVDALRARMLEQEIRSVFVKLSCSSSASCLAIYTVKPEGGDFVMTTIERARTGWYNSLRVRRYPESSLFEILDFLLKNGSQIEVAVPKAKLAGAYFDCRVLVIDDEARFTVVRQNRHPITNLHLGGWRGDLEALEQRAPDGLAAAHQSCVEVARSHGCFTLGVDVMFERGFAQHRIIESNAFGDLLPNLERDGLSVYATQIERARARGSRPQTPA